MAGGCLVAGVGDVSEGQRPWCRRVRTVEGSGSAGWRGVGMAIELLSGRFG